MSEEQGVLARVAAVRLRPDGSYAITLAAGGRDLLWLVSAEPLRLGDLVHVTPDAAHSMTINGQVGPGKVTVLEGGQLRVEPSKYARRVVPAMWLERVRGVMRRPLYSYQAEGAGWIASRLALCRGAILADEPGLGKTAQTLAAVVAAGLLPTIIVCPASTKNNWLREPRYLRRQLRMATIEGRTGDLPRAHGYVLNYELLRDREEQLSRLGARSFILDEAHYIKEPEPNKDHRAAVATRLAHRIGHTVMLTGTPLLNRPTELWRLLHIADRRAWPSFGDFRRRYCVKPPDDEVDTGTEVVTSHGGVYRLEELRASTDEAILRRLKSDLLTSLPPKKRRTVIVDLDDAHRTHYAAAEKNVVQWLRKVRSNERARAASRNQALVRLTMLRHIAAVGKLRKALPLYLEQWFEQERQPLVIFAFHQDVVGGVHAICRRMGVRRSGISGRSNTRQRTVEIDRFVMGEADVFIAPVRSAGVGINLQSACNALFIERLWTPSLMTQAEDRLHRIGQSRTVTITYMDARNTVDQHVAQVLDAKQQLIDRVVDDVDSTAEPHAASDTVDLVADRMVGNEQVGG